MNKGKLVKGTGRVVGTMFEYNLVLAGVIVGGIALVAGNKALGKSILKTGKKLGRFVGDATKVSTNIVGTMMEAASSERAALAKSIGEKIVKSRVRIYGDSSAFYDKDKIIEAHFENAE